MSTQQIEMEPIGESVYVYATIEMGPVNPVDFVNNTPCWKPQAGATAAGVESGKGGQGELAPVLGGFVPGQEWETLPEDLPQFLQTIELGADVDGRFAALVRFGLADDRRALGRRDMAKHWMWSDEDVPRRDRAHVCVWVSDGTIDHFGPFARPNTPYDFKLRLDLAQRRVSAWVNGRGDDDWFLLADDVPLPTKMSAVHRMQITTYPDAPIIDGLTVLSSAWEPGESVRPHPLAKQDRVVAPDKGFTLQSMRSSWRKPGKHVTIFRKTGVHAGFPDVAQAGPDHLVCSWRNGSHTGGTPGLSLSHSYDGGRTWSERTLVSELKINCPRLQRLSDGTLLLTGDIASSNDQYTARWDVVMWNSTDGGQTWGDESWLRTEQAGGPGAIVHSRILELSDGSWLLSASSFPKLPDDGTAEKLEFYRSTDRGRNWEYWSGPMDYPPRILSEPSTLEIEPGKLVVYARESRNDLPGATGFSEDTGRTWRFQDLPFPITGRTCAGFLRDGRVMLTFRSGIGRAALWAWVGDVNDLTGPQPMGIHLNDSHSVGLKDGALHIDSDGVCGQFTKYNLRPPDTEHSTLDLTFEVQTLANAGRAASVTVPFAGILRLFPDHVVMAVDHVSGFERNGNPETLLRAEVTPGQFHTYRVVSRLGRFELFIDGALVWDTDRADSQLQSLPWTKISAYALAFGNEEHTLYETLGYGRHRNSWGNPNVVPVCIAPEVTGHSIWRRVEAVTDDPDPRIGRRVTSWDAGRDGFPDQYQLDHIIEVDASVSGHDSGYSGWVQLDDGRVFVVNYTDDTAAASVPNPHMFGVSWIRGTFLEVGDIPSK